MPLFGSPRSCSFSEYTLPSGPSWSFVKRFSQLSGHSTSGKSSSEEGSSISDDRAEARDSKDHIISKSEMLIWMVAIHRRPSPEKTIANDCRQLGRRPENSARVVPTLVSICQALFALSNLSRRPEHSSTTSSSRTDRQKAKVSSQTQHTAAFSPLAVDDMFTVFL